jgi:hypothetical protein
MMRLRHVHPLDYERVLAVIDAWWDGRPMSARLSHVFFSHFAPTSFVLEGDGELTGFLLGFLMSGGRECWARGCRRGRRFALISAVSRSDGHVSPMGDCGRPSGRSVFRGGST